MNQRNRTAWSLACLLATAGAVAADAKVGPPPGFPFKPGRNTEHVVYSETEAEYPNPIRRELLEQQCDMARQLGKTTKHPSFEAGHDQPNHRETVRMVGTTQTVTFHTVRAYLCDPMPPDRDLCGCTYRMVTGHVLHLDRHEAGRHEIVRYDIEKQQGTRFVGPDAPAPAGSARNLAALAPQVMGRDVVAGVPCVVRRQVLPGGWVDRCIAWDPDGKLPAALRDQELASSFVVQDHPDRTHRSRITKVVADALVNAGVFDLPPGANLKATSVKPREAE